jgi:hypothetical protein
VSFGSTTLISNGAMEVFVAKIDTDGVWQWAKSCGGTSSEWGNDISVDTSGNVYIIGSFFGTASFGSTSLNSLGSEDVFVAKLDTNGVWQWAKNGGGTQTDRGYGVSVDTSGNVYITGDFWGTASFGSTTLTSLGNSDIFVAKLSTIGVWQWAKSAGSGGNMGETGTDIAVDSSGNAYVTGYFMDTATFGTTSLTSQGSQDVFIAKLDTDGVWQWAKNGGGTSSDGGSDITVDTSGNIYVTGSFSATAIFGSTSLTSQGEYDVFIAKLTSNAIWHWATSAGGTRWDSGIGIAVDTTGNIYVTGEFMETAMFGSISLTSQGSWDVFIAKLPSTIGDFRIIKLGIVQVVREKGFQDVDPLIINKNSSAWVLIWSSFNEIKYVNIEITYNHGQTYIETGPNGNGVPLKLGINEVFIPGGSAHHTATITDPWIPPGTGPFLRWTTTGSDSNIRAFVDCNDNVNEITENNNEKTTAAKNFVDSKDLNILVVPVYFPQLSDQNPNFLQSTIIEEDFEFLLSTYPLADNRFKKQIDPAQAITWSGSWPPWYGSYFSDWFYKNHVITISTNAINRGFDRVIIVYQDDSSPPSSYLPVGAMAIGMGKTPINRIPVLMEYSAISIWKGILAHELSHTYDLWHPHDIGPEVFNAERFWVNNRDYKAWKDIYTYMSYRENPYTDNIWIDIGRYMTDPLTVYPLGLITYPKGEPLIKYEFGTTPPPLFKNLLPPQNGQVGWYLWPGDPKINYPKTWIYMAPPHVSTPYQTWNLQSQFKAAPSALSSGAYLINGIIFENGTINADAPWYYNPLITPTYIPSNVGSHKIVLLDGNNDIISQFYFNVSFYYICIDDPNPYNVTGVHSDSMPFLLSIPSNPSTRFIQLRDSNDTILVNKEVSLHAPEITTLYPNGGETILLNSECMIEWEGNDPDNDPVVYEVYYSNNAGYNWFLLKQGITQTQYLWNTSDLTPGDEYKIKVVACDGINQAFDESDEVFTLAFNLPPIADADGPYSGDVGESIQLDGTGSYDPDGQIVSYEWDLDNDGQYDDATDAITSHSWPYRGVYTIGLKVTDDYGETDTDSASVRITGPDPPTVVLVYPQGGETLKDTIKVEWYAYDTEEKYDLPIYLYYYDNSWIQINDVLENTGEYMWDTTTLPDGTYKLAVSAYDSDGNSDSDMCDSFQIKNHEEPPENLAPNKPNKPSGTINGKAGEEYTYTTSTSDPDGDTLFYKWDYGDNTDSGWLGSYISGDTCETSHIWQENVYNIRVKARDKYGKESPWSDPLSIAMPKNKLFINSFIERLMEHFPVLFQMFQRFMQILQI